MYTKSILVINPRAIFTRIAVYENYNILFLKDIQHPDSELGRFSHYLEQVEYRRSKIISELTDNGFELANISAIVGLGGLIKPVESGVYALNQKLVDDLKSSEYGEDYVNLGGILADELVKGLPETKAFIVDPVVVDEFDELARFTGHPLFKRKSIFHALNHKAMAQKHAKMLMKKYEEMKLIVVHLGTAISVAAHKFGRVVDSNQALDGDGPFSTESTGSLPIGDVIRYCFHSGKSENEILDMVMHHGGMYSYLHTFSGMEVDARVNDGDMEAIKVFEAMAYQVSKEVGAMYAVLDSEIDGIIITGGMSHSRWFVNKITSKVRNMGPVHVYPGVDELDSMSQAALAALRGQVEVKEYK
jgi:butyrate kinase